MTEHWGLEENAPYQENTKTYETKSTDSMGADDVGMSETGRMVHSHGMDVNAAMSQHRMKIPIHHRVYATEQETFSVQATLKPMDHSVDHGHWPGGCWGYHCTRDKS